MGYQPSIRPHQLSVSTQTSGLCSYRSSGSSFLSDPQSRFSAVSSVSSWSNHSMLPTDPFMAQEECPLPKSATPSHTASPIEGPTSHISRRRTTPRVPAQEKDYYKTCVSRKQRARRSNTIQKYFCTACREPFVEKADWKRHEESFQERPEQFRCDNCYAIYFLDKDFVTHHEKAHGCIPCSEVIRCSQKRHVQSARSQRKTRTGWGCGFCYHFSDNWTSRCNHIAQHFDQEQKTMKDWNHSVVIYSLLQRPEIVGEWQAILSSKQRHFIGFGWHPVKTGRVEGYPESDPTLQLQDALEYFTPDQDAAALAQWAFDQAVPKVARQRAEVDAPPPVPRKNYRLNHKASLTDIMKETESWNQFVKSIVNDDHLPTGVTYLGNDMLEEHGNSWLDTES